MGQQPGAPPGSRPGMMEGRGHTVGRYVHIYRAQEAQGKLRDVEKGAVVTWKILYSGDREEGKGTRTTTPNHADKDTACAAQQSGGSQREALSPRGNSTQIQLGMCVWGEGLGHHPQHPHPMAPGQTSLLTVTMEREGTWEVGAPTLCGIALRQGLNKAF